MFGKPNIYLVGPMGSGKTAVGRQLARMLGVPFHDSDTEIELRTGVDVPFIFEREGEPGFRQREREAIEALVQLSPIVMATGGGAVLAAENRRLLSDHGVVVFLETSVGQQLQRVGSGRGRPLLQQQEDLPTLLRRMRAIRDPLYREVADITVVTDNRRVAKVAESILRQIERHRPPYTSKTVLKLDVPLGDRAYPILIGESLLGDAAVLDAHIRARDVLLVSNTTIAPLYAERVRAALGDRRVVEVRLPDGEQYKTLEYVTRILDCLVANRFARDSLLLALGGGVVGDMVGFAAACYQRGVDFAQAPTTLLSQVDSSVGGKTGVNHPGGKNLIGAFHQPRVVFSDTTTLRTLPARELRAGLAEVIKYGLVFDAAFLGWLETHLDDLLRLDPAALAQAIHRSCELKAGVVLRDERETGERALLNLGHTFGHAIETATGYTEWLHGEAVAAGTLVAADLSARIGLLPREDVERVRELFRRAGLPCDPPRIGAARAHELMRVDKKVKGGRIRLILLERLGRARFTADYPDDALAATLSAHFG